MFIHYIENKSSGKFNALKLMECLLLIKSTLIDHTLFLSSLPIQVWVSGVENWSIYHMPRYYCSEGHILRSTAPLLRERLNMPLKNCTADDESVA